MQGHNDQMGGQEQQTVAWLVSGIESARRSLQAVSAHRTQKQCEPMSNANLLPVRLCIRFLRL